VESLESSNFRMPTRLRTQLKARHGGEDLVKRALDRRQTIFERDPPASPQAQQQESLIALKSVMS